MQKTMNVKERVDTPRGWSFLGAIIGACAGAVLMKKVFQVLEERAFGTGSDEFRYRGERYSTGVGIWFDRALEAHPLMLALGSAALGMFASLLLPVSNRERQLIEPAKRKAQESISHLGEQLEHKLQGQELGSTGSATGTAGSMGSVQSSTMGSMGNIGSSEGLMGYERPSLNGEDRSDTLAAPTSSRIPPVPPLDDLSTKIH